MATKMDESGEKTQLNTIGDHDNTTEDGTTSTPDIPESINTESSHATTGEVTSKAMAEDDNIVDQHRSHARNNDKEDGDSTSDNQLESDGTTSTPDIPESINTESSHAATGAVTSKAIAEDDNIVDQHRSHARNNDKEDGDSTSDNQLESVMATDSTPIIQEAMTERKVQDICEEVATSQYNLEEPNRTEGASSNKNEVGMDDKLPLGADFPQDGESGTDAFIPLGSTVSPDTDNNQSFARKKALKMIHSRMRRHRQVIKPYICPLCRLVIWGQWARYHQHIKSHKKRGRKPKSQKRAPTLHASSNSKLKRIIKSEKAKTERNVPVQDSRPLKKRLSSMLIDHKGVDSQLKGINSCSKSLRGTRKRTAVESSKLDLVSVPIDTMRSSKSSKKPGHTDTNPALYLCAKCCQGFAEVVDLVGHVAVCTGESAVNKTKSNDKKPNLKKKSKPAGRRTVKSRPKVIIKTERETIVGKNSIRSKRKGIPSPIIPEPLGKDELSDESHADDMDWVPDIVGSVESYSGNASLSTGEIEKAIKWKPKVHNTRQRQVKKGDHICRECGNFFTHASALIRHMTLHSHTPRRYPCKMCSRSFTQSCHLNNHQRKVHQNPSAPGVALKKEPGSQGSDEKTRRKVTARSKKDKPARQKHSQNPNNECKVCLKRFSHRSALHRHQILHTGIRRYKCHICQLKFTQSCHLKSHINKVHLGVPSKRPRVSCTVCEEAFASKRALRLHMMKHNEEPKIMCDICKIFFTEDDLLIKHIEKVHDGKDTDARYTTCEECGKEFSFPSSLRRHKVLHVGLKKYECKICFRKFIQKPHYASHICRAELAAGEKSNLCVKCGKSFSSATSMRKHELSVHAESKDFKCPVCNKGFATYAHLQVHVGGAHGRGNHLCHQCGKSFSFKSSYLRHLKFHTGVKPYKCKYCEKSFTQSSHSKSHEMSHTNTEKQPCRFCGKMFKNLRNIKHHIKKNHGGETCTEFKCHRCGLVAEGEDALMQHIDDKCNDERHNTVCSICKKSFPTNSHLVRHLRSHTNERPFKCNICDKTFTQNSHLKNHVMRHGKLKPWQCDVCGRNYASKEYLKQHVKKLHEDRPADSTIPGPDGTLDPKKKKRTDCEFCGKMYKNRKYLKVHIKRKHMIENLVMHQKPLADNKLAEGTNKEAPLAPVEKPQSMVIYPSETFNRMQIPIPVEIRPVPVPLEIMPMPVPLEIMPNVTTASSSIMTPQAVPHTSVGVAPPQAGFLTEMQAVKDVLPRKPEDVQAPNMIADSMRLITVNWW